LPNNSTNKKLGGYLAGLIEGDGSIIVPVWSPPPLLCKGGGPKTIRNEYKRF